MASVEVRLSVFIVFSFGLAQLTFAAKDSELQEPQRDERTWPGASPYGVAVLKQQEIKKLLKEGRFPEASEILESLTKEHPKDTALKFALAKVKFQAGQRSDALKIIEQLIPQFAYPSRGDLVKRARIMSRMFYAQDLAQEYQEALQALRNADYKEASKKFSALQLKDPTNVDVLVRLGQSSFQANELENATDWFTRAKNLVPWDTEVLAWLGRVLFQKGELGKSLKEFKSIRAVESNPELFLIWHAQALAAANLYQDAVKILEREVSRDPMKLQSILALSKIKLEIPDWDQKQFWMIRRDLQLVLSRLSEFEKKKAYKSLNEFDVNMGAPPDLKEQTLMLLKQVERRLAGNPNS